MSIKSCLQVLHIATVMQVQDTDDDSSSVAMPPPPPGDLGTIELGNVSLGSSKHHSGDDGLDEESVVELPQAHVVVDTPLTDQQVMHGPLPEIPKPFLGPGECAATDSVTSVFGRSHTTCIVWWLLRAVCIRGGTKMKLSSCH